MRAKLRIGDIPRANAAVALGVVGISLAWLAQPLRGGDTGPLMAGTETLGDCLARLDLFLCAQTTPIGPWPVLQYVPDLIAHAAGASIDGRVRVLAILSGLGVAGAVAAAWVALRRLGVPEWRWAFLLVVAAGPALAYGSSTWGEMLGAGLLTVFVAAALLRVAPFLVGLAAFGAGLTKETGYPFVIALGLVALLLARQRARAPIRPQVIAVLVGVAAAVAASGALNLIRFGTPRNAYYLDPGLRTTTAGHFFELMAGLVVAPNGGIVFFWPSAFILVALLVGLPLAAALRGTMAWRDAWAAVALLAVVGGLLAGLASWWAPFGWWAWGPRLSLPWVFSLLLLALAAFGERLTPVAARVLASAAGFAGVAVLVVLAALPHVGFLWHPETVGDFFFVSQTAVCPGGGPPPTPEYYACLHEEMWTRPPIWLDALAGLRRLEGVATLAAVVLVAVGSLAALRREVIAKAAEHAASAPSVEERADVVPDVST